jgi:hypothetical protein
MNGPAQPPYFIQAAVSFPAKGNLFSLALEMRTSKVSSVSFGKFPIGSRFKMNGYIISVYPAEGDNFSPEL